MIPSVIEPATTTNCATAYFHSHLLYYLQNNSLYVEFLTGITLLRKVAMNEHAVTQNTKTGRSSLLHICHLSIKRRCCVVSLLLATVLLTCKCLENALFFFFAVRRRSCTPLKDCTSPVTTHITPLPTHRISDEAGFRIRYF